MIRVSEPIYMNCLHSAADLFGHHRLVSGYIQHPKHLLPCENSVNWILFLILS